VHPPSSPFAQADPMPPAPARCPCGTRNGWRTVASFRTWRGWSDLVAQDPALVAARTGQTLFDGASEGDSAPLERIAGTGNR